MSTLTLIKYNNYFNRILKGVSFHSLNDYSSIPGSTFNKVNFDKKDGIDTYHYLNIPNIETADILENYDYLLVSDDGSDEIKSKWFITEHKWTRQRQYKLTLHRDVLADKYDKYKDQPFYCRRGLPDVDSPLVYNSEGRQYNQILKSRTLLKQDNQANRYIIGFVDKTWKGAKVYQGETIQISDEDWRLLNNTSPRYITDNIAVYLPLVGKATGPDEGQQYTTGTDCHIWVSVSDDTVSDANWGGAAPDSPAISSGIGGTELGVDEGQGRRKYELLAMNMIGKLSEFESYCRARAETVMPSPSRTYQEYDNKVVKYDGKAYRITFPTTTFSWSVGAPMDNAIALQIYNKFKSNQYGTSLWSPTSGIGGEITVKVRSRVVVPVITEIGVDLSTEVSPRPEANTPYNIFVIEDDAAGIARNFAGYFASQYAGGNVLYDLQLFPFKPDTTTTGRVNINTEQSPIYLEWATSDSKAGTCTHDEIKTYTGNSNAAIMNNKKAGANQDMCRLIAPDGSNAWDFNPALIGGVPANSIKYEFTLIPFASYLHIYPTFNNLYGTVNKSVGDKAGETRGMVCTGPWSLPYSTDNWATYQLQNSAFRDSFNRQVENMSVVQDIQRAQEVFQLGIAPYQGLFGGLGSSPLGPISAIAGMTLGTASAAADLELGDIARKEQINYTKDQFYNSLRNIQAQARPLASNSSITIGNSWFPIIEYYSATDEEKQFLIEDLKVHGWMMGIATTFSTIRNNITNQHTYTVYPTRYIQGDLINVDIGEDAHMSNEIARELNEGVYIDHV